MTMRTSELLSVPRSRFSHRIRPTQSKLGLGNEAYRRYFHYRNLSHSIVFSGKGVAQLYAIVPRLG